MTSLSIHPWKTWRAFEKTINALEIVEITILHGIFFTALSDNIYSMRDYLIIKVKCLMEEISV